MEKKKILAGLLSAFIMCTSVPAVGSSAAENSDNGTEIIYSADFENGVNNLPAGTVSVRLLFLIPEPTAAVNALYAAAEKRTGMVRRFCWTVCASPVFSILSVHG